MNWEHAPRNGPILRYRLRDDSTKVLDLRRLSRQDAFLASKLQVLFRFDDTGPRFSKEVSGLWQMHCASALSKK
jgi:hypothetical protein